MEKKDLFEELFESMNEEMSKDDKKEVFDKTEKLLSNDFNAVIVATNNGQLVVGRKYNIISVIISILSEMYKKNQISKSELKSIFMSVITEGEDFKKITDMLKEIFE